MTILFTRFPLESAYGGAEIQTMSLMKGLMEHGHTVAFAGSCPVLLNLCAQEHIPATEIHIGPPPVTVGGAVSFAWRRYAMKQRLVALLEQFPHLNILCMLSLSEKILLTREAAAQGVHPVWIEHDRVGRWLESNPWLPQLRAQSALAMTVPVSHLSGRIYQRLGWDAHRIHPIPNGVDPVRLGAAQHRTRGSAQDPLKLLCIARLSWEKGVDIALESLTAVPHHVTLRIVGTGREEKHLRTLVRTLHLEHRVSIETQRADVGSFYAECDALVLPSRDNDPFGMVAAEAMLLGLPVIVTDQCGIADYLHHEQDALVVRASSPSALSQGILQLCQPAMFNRLAKNGPMTAQKKFSVKTMVQQYETLFTEFPMPQTS